MSETGWHQEEIKAAIRKRGVTLTALSIRHGYEGSACRRAVSYPWPAVERIIADFLGEKPESIWPSRYDALGRPRSRIHESQSTARRRRRLRQK